MKNKSGIYMIDKPETKCDCPECDCPECDFDCQCTSSQKPYIHKTPKQIVEEQEDRNSIGYWNDIRTGRP